MFAKRYRIPASPTPSPRPPAPRRRLPRRGDRAFTLVEMLVAMAITLVMMAAVVTLFANVSNSVRDRRATVEMTSQARHLRNVLQQDLQGATCPGVTWQRPDSNHGYIELIEGIYTDQNPTPLIQDLDDNKIFAPNESKIDPALSPIPRNNIGADANSDGKITAQELEAHYQQVGSLVPGALGDSDDILMLTTRNEREPFVGRMPTDIRDGDDARPFNVNGTGWSYGSIESPLAEVVWFAIENPSEDENPNKFFGEPGMRTIYRRALLIAPWLNPYSRKDNNGNEIPFRHEGDEFKAEPGLMRILPDGISLDQAFAAIIAFQDRYDLSVRLEWDHNIGSQGRWKIVANTLADLTKRENRFGHFGHHITSSGKSRSYPYPMASWGRGYDDANLAFETDEEAGPAARPATGTARAGTPAELEAIVEYSIDDRGDRYPTRPFVYVDTESAQPSTAQAILNDDGGVERVVFGPVPLWGERRGQDIMMTGVLGFDLRVYDPGAPLFGVRRDRTDPNSVIDTVLQPSDPGWAAAYTSADHTQGVNSMIGRDDNVYPLVGQGAYVDMGYRYNRLMLTPAKSYMFEMPAFQNSSATYPWFFVPRGLSDVFGELLAPGYTVYDTWSFHYENNGVNEDADSTAAGVQLADEGTNGLDDVIPDGGGDLLVAGDHIDDVAVFGPDDAGERETVPPYDKPLRGMQVLIRTYEPDSRAIRQVRVNQHFLPE